MKKIITSTFFALSAIILVSGCGSDSTPPPTTLTGTAATGAPIDGTVYVKDAKGVEKSIATAANGSFTLDVTGMTPTYLLKVVPSNGSATLYSYAAKNGTVNLTPTTNLAMLLASNSSNLDTVYAGWDGSAISEAAVKAAEGTVRANLAAEFTAAGLDINSVDLFTTPFTADGSGIDGVMDNLTIAVDFVAGSYTFADTSGTTFNESAAAPAPANAISIVTVSGATHVLNGTYSSACYGSTDGRIDSVTITGTTWVNAAAIYPGDTSCSNTPAVSAITATISKKTDKQISGWTGQGGVIPTRADGSGQLSATETVTPFDITVTNVTGSAFAGVSIGFTATGFYVFDDTASGYIMYRDDDGSIASASDPFVSAGSGLSGTGSTGGTGGSGSSSFALSTVTITGSAIEMANTSWSSNCYNDGTNDRMDTVIFNGSTGVTINKTTYTSGSSCTSWAGATSTTGDIENTLSKSTTGWLDAALASASSGPMKADGSGAIPDSTAFTYRIIRVTSTNDPSEYVGGLVPFGFVVDDTSVPPTVYRVGLIASQPFDIMIIPLY